MSLKFFLKAAPGMQQGLEIYWNIAQDQCQAIVGGLSICLPKSVWGRVGGSSKYSTSQSLRSALKLKGSHTTASENPLVAEYFIRA